MDEFVVEATGIEKSFRTGAYTVPVLRGIDLRVLKGEWLYLAGPSGSGKSTLLSILGCILTPDVGSISVLGQNVAGLRTDALARFRLKHIGFVFQHFHLFAGLRAWENVRVPMDLLGKPKRAGRREALRLLDLVGLKDRAYHYINQMSGGQKQRVALARALAADPDIILADEPTASLDFESGHNAMKLLRELSTTMGKSIVIVTHDARIYPLADRILTMEDGRIKMLRLNARKNQPAEVIRFS